jgi:hypothetical protein
VAYKCGYKTGYTDPPNCGSGSSSRCDCSKNNKCDCFITDDGYPGLRVNNNTTLVRGKGTSDSPYYVENIHHPSFIPPAARVRTITATPAATLKFISFDIIDVNTDGIFNLNIPDRFTINHAGIYTFGASIQWTGPPDLYTNIGIFYGSSISTGIRMDPSAASPAAAQTVLYRADKTNPGDTVSRMAPYSASVFADYSFKAGDVLKVGVFGFNPPNPGATSCTFWICYS